MPLWVRDSVALILLVLGIIAVTLGIAYAINTAGLTVGILLLGGILLLALGRLIGRYDPEVAAVRRELRRVSRSVGTQEPEPPA